MEKKHKVLFSPFPEQLDDLGLMDMVKIRTTIMVKMMSTVVFVVITAVVPCMLV